MRLIPALCVLALASCSDPEPVGEPMFELLGGCYTPCAVTTVYRDGVDLDLARWDAEGELERLNHGRLTAEGEAALADAAAKFGPELIGMLPTCGGADGVDYRVTLEREGKTHRLTYCVSAKEFGIDALTELMRTIAQALLSCESNAYVTVGECAPG